MDGVGEREERNAKFLRRIMQTRSLRRRGECAEEILARALVARIERLGRIPQRRRARVREHVELASVAPDERRELLERRRIARRKVLADHALPGRRLLPSIAERPDRGLQVVAIDLQRGEVARQPVAHAIAVRIEWHRLGSESRCQRIDASGQEHFPNRGCEAHERAAPERPGCAQEQLMAEECAGRRGLQRMVGTRVGDRIGKARLGRGDHEDAPRLHHGPCDPVELRERARLRSPDREVEGAIFAS